MDASVVVAVVGLAVAWLLFRTERAASRRREILSARSLLFGVQRGMVSGHGDRPGWGDEYFNEIWDEDRAKRRARDDYAKVVDGGYEVVFGVPTEPLASLISTPYAGDLISEDVVFRANVGLWRIRNLNQLVDQQTQLITQNLPDIADPRIPKPDLTGLSDEEAKAKEAEVEHRVAERLGRRVEIANAIGSQSEMLHLRGVGDANGPEGWYRLLREAVAKNVADLDCEYRQKLYPVGLKTFLAVGDAIAVLAVLAVSAIALVKHDDSHFDRHPRPGYSWDWHGQQRPLPPQRYR